MKTSRAKSCKRFPLITPRGRWLCEVQGFNGLTIASLMIGSNQTQAWGGQDYSHRALIGSPGVLCEGSAFGMLGVVDVFRVVGHQV